MPVIHHFVVVLTLAAALASPVAAADPKIEILDDLVFRFPDAKVSNCTHHAAGLSQISGGVKAPGIFLHPDPRGDSLAEFQLSLPKLNAGERLFFLFRIGLRDGIPWRESRPNGVEFQVHVGSTVRYRETLRQDGWQHRAVELSDKAGQETRLSLGTNAVAGNTAYDWALFGEPLVIRLRGSAEPKSLEESRPGLTLARVRCSTASSIAWTHGARETEQALIAGEHWIAHPFDSPRSLQFSVRSGDAELAELVAGIHVPSIKIERLEWASPLLTKDHDFAVIVGLANRGLGSAPTSKLAWSEFHDGGRFASSFLTVPSLGPGEETRLRVDRPKKKSEGSIRFQIGDQTIEARVEAADQNRSDVRLSAGSGAQLRYASHRLIAEVRIKDQVQRLASLYPLASLAIEEATGTRREIPIRVDAANFGDSGGSIEGHFLYGGSKIPVVVAIKRHASAPRFHFDLRVHLPRGLKVTAFRGPQILAGDRSFGSAKDFALFGGLEMLEASEHSSSTRDLAYPLSDRRVPASHKIANPIMAVQANDGLVAMMWSPTQEWRTGDKLPAAYFSSPHPTSDSDQTRMGLFAPSVGEHLSENSFHAKTAIGITEPETWKLNFHLVLDHADWHRTDRLVQGPHSAGLLLRSYSHYFDIFGFPKASQPPRDWNAELRLSLGAYANSLWNEDPAGWRHCDGWPAGLLVGHAVPQLIAAKSGFVDDLRSGIEKRVGRVLDRAGKNSLWRRNGCHILQGELPFYSGWLGENLISYREYGKGLLRQRENNLWVWRPRTAKHRTLGRSGDHTLGQASDGAWQALRAARLTGDPKLRRDALASLAQMDRYEFPRGAQMWECPLYQPDILAAARAIRAYVEAYKLTGERRYIDHARYWAWTGLPFLYLWEQEGYPTMRYNVIAVIGSTFHSHSWLGLPVVWCGLVYAYALQDLAPYDDSLDWKEISRGITHSAMWQQYTKGRQRGCYPDSWHMVDNAPRPADINPENILVNGYRLRGQGPEIHSRRIANGNTPALINSPARITKLEGSVDAKRLEFSLAHPFESYAFIAPVDKPSRVSGLGEQAASSSALQEARAGWIYIPELRGIVLKDDFKTGETHGSIDW